MSTPTHVPDETPHWADTLGPMHNMEPPTDDPGTAWHPTGHVGDLPDLTSDKVRCHSEKPERDHQIDGHVVLAAEDSADSPYFGV